MIVLFVMREALKTGEDGFETGIVAPIDGDAPKGFEEGRKQRGGLGRLFRVQSFHGSTAEVFRQLIGPQGFEDRRKFIESGGDGAPCGRISMVDATGVIQNDVARFAARSVSTGIGELSKSMAQRRHGNAPNIRAAQYG